MKSARVAYNEVMNPPRPANFPKLDPAEPAFWDVRFAADFTPWDQGGVPQSLLDYVARHPEPRKVLIPGCGTAHEAHYLRRLGWAATAIDFSPAAVARARELMGEFGAHVQEADFFGAALREARFEVIYERAFLCALPRSRWADWAARMAELIEPGGRLIGFFYFDDNPKGPPFGISRDALNALLGGHFACIDDAAPPDSIGPFVGRERWQVWQRR